MSGRLLLGVQVSHPLLVHRLILLLRSLSDLCNFAGVDYESETEDDDWPVNTRRSASLSSNMSAFSCVSVLPSEELDKLLEDVKSLGDSNLQVSGPRRPRVL